MCRILYHDVGATIRLAVCLPLLHKGVLLAPFRKGVVPVTYVTFSDLIQIGILVVGIIALFQNIKKK